MEHSIENLTTAEVQKRSFIPFAMPDIDDAEFAEIREALISGWITTGPKAKRFEAEFAKRWEQNMPLL